MNISRDDATIWASWFRALGDPTRVLILNLLATEGRPLTVNEIVDAVDVGQSTVSHHLKILADVRFVLVDRRGTIRGYYDALAPDAVTKLLADTNHLLREQPR